MKGWKNMQNEEKEEFHEPNLSEGYCIKIKVVNGGFTVSDPEPIEEDEYSEEQDTIPDLPTMLKNVMAVIQDNPVGESEQDGFNTQEPIA